MASHNKKNLTLNRLKHRLQVTKNIQRDILNRTTFYTKNGVLTPSKGTPIAGEENITLSTARASVYLPILLFFSILLSGCTNSSEKKFIAVNLVGYETGTPKQAFLANTEADLFQIVRTDNSEVVMTAPVGLPSKIDSVSGDRLSTLDFSIFNYPGEYKIVTLGPGKVTSLPFQIRENVYSDALQTMVKSYYYHRCGTAVGNGTEWRYDVCHLDDAPFFDDPESAKFVTGGWHDAGDYNKFSGNTALSAGLMLYTYESKPDNFTDAQLGIPESGNGTPDILDEVSWALEWLLKMQREDGAVYHKVSQKKWIGEYLPNEDPSTRYIFDVSSAATASFAAAAALGARHLAEFDTAFSMELSRAAKKAWAFLEMHPDNKPIGGFKNPDGVSGGGYGDPNDLDERLWASVELYRLTDDDAYLNYFIQNYKKISHYPIPPISWRDAESLAFRAFLASDTKGRYHSDLAFIREKTILHADAILVVHKNNIYRNLIKPDQYYWGSNSVGLAYAFDLIQAYKLTNDLEFKHAALDQLHYVLGRNPFNLSQVTGVGSAAVKKPYHQLSEMGGFSSPVPGMLVGGPNNRILLNEKEISPWPGKNYEDTFANFFVNEPAINFTAIAIYVTNAFSTTQSQSNELTTSK